ncbi:alanyl-tRNA editing protein [Vibrio sp. LaRot3]|uniref:alanyl-tRNA editing protein n=1 Tax=Vibrio sp. LaRot3 TaxID=2998829 RepID=UPI0022CE2502|nr:alanyl-tRNA editing protein [Vibrio sp. LaRot3]MDA0146865.1 alanyl-tRNA editing protein [Vibrio sp. LaRot3]
MQITPTITQFCHQTWQLTSSLLLAQQDEKCLYIVTEQTPFHPVSHIWPDHPSDKGSLSMSGQSYEVVQCLVGAVELATGELYVDKAIPVKRDTEGWVFVVAHQIEAEASSFELGCEVELIVDKAYQQALSRGHSAGHLAFLALNKVLATEGYWRKDADRKDPHGHFDFNSYAQETSFVTEDKCLDTYRLGKTLRKRGLNSAEMLEDLDKIEQLVNQQLVTWLELSSAVEMKCHGSYLTDSRYWHCDLKEGVEAVIPCGGSHISSLKELPELKVSLRQLDAQNIEMQTDVIGHVTN